MKEKLAKIKAVLFDWDGVFHAGEKNELGSSTFSEADSMGVNMLRFGLWLKNNKQMPFIGIISGENNVTARYWADREHIDATYSGVKNKVEILPMMKQIHGIEPDEIMFVYDDILDLSLAKEVGFRVLINRLSNPLFKEYCRENNLYDMATVCDGGNHAVREASELTLDMMGKFVETIEKRMAFEGDYTDYNTERLHKKCTHFLYKEGEFRPRE